METYNKKEKIGNVVISNPMKQQEDPNETKELRTSILMTEEIKQNESSILKSQEMINKGKSSVALT